jgi:hypothetical protein
MSRPSNTTVCPLASTVVATLESSFKRLGKAIVQLTAKSICPPVSTAASSAEKLQSRKTFAGPAEVLAPAVVNVAAMMTTAASGAANSDRPTMSHLLQDYHDWAAAL